MTDADSRKRGRRPLTWLVLVLSAPVVFMILANFIPYLLASGRSSNVVHSPWHGFKVLAAAEEFYRQNDLDGNGIRDYWVGDISGLYYLDVGLGNHLKLIEPSMADRDANPIRKDTGRRKFLTPIEPPTLDPWRYAVVPEKWSGIPYGKDLDGDGAALESETTYAFCAWPRTYSSSRRYTWICNETGLIWRKDTGGIPVRRFPHDPEKEGWLLVTGDQSN